MVALQRDLNFLVYLRFYNTQSIAYGYIYDHLFYVKIYSPALIQILFRLMNQHNFNIFFYSSSSIF